MNPDKIRNVLNILFMVLALAAIIIYFAAKDDLRYYKARESGCQETDSDERQSHALLPGMQSRRSS